MQPNKETITGPTDPGNPGKEVGLVFGNVGSGQFRCLLSDPSVREMDYVEVYHPVDGWVLGLIESIELVSDFDQERAMLHMSGAPGKVSFKRVGLVSVIGKRDANRNLYRPLTPVLPSSRIFVAGKELLASVLGLVLERKDGVYLGKILHTDADVVLDAGTLVQKHAAIIAKSGSGKSYACGVLAEELNKLNIPVVVLDLHGEYRSLVAPNIDNGDYKRMSRFGVSPKGLGDKVIEYTLATAGEVGDRPVTLGIDIRSFRAEDLLELMGLKNVGAASSILYNALAKAGSILGDDYDLYDVMTAVQSENNPAKWNILNGLEHLMRLPLFSSPPTPLTEIVVPGKVTVIELKDVPLDIQQIGAAALLKRLFSARKDGTVPPFMLVVEEAHNFCPQGSTVITSPLMQTLASEGRKFGLGLTIVSQRPAKVDKNVLSQCGTQMILKVTNPNDLKSVMASVEGLDSRMADEIQNLPVSIALVVGGNISTPILVEVRTRATKHGGEAVDILRDISTKYTDQHEDDAGDLTDNY